MSYNLYTTLESASSGRMLDGVAVSGAAAFYSDPVSCQRSDGFSVTITWTGTPAGNFEIWKTDRENPVLTSDGDWTKDTDFNGGTGTLAAGGAAGQITYSAANAKSGLWRVKYTNTSSSGTVYASANRPKFG